MADAILLAALFLGEARELGPFFTGVLTVLTAVPGHGQLVFRMNQGNQPLTDDSRPV